MATAAEWAALRANTGDSITSLTDIEAEALFAQATAMYSAGAVFAGVRVLRILELMGGAYKNASYVQNQESVSESDVFKHLTTLLGIWQKQLDAALAVDREAVTGDTPPKSGTVRLRPVW